MKRTDIFKMQNFQFENYRKYPHKFMRLFFLPIFYFYRMNGINLRIRVKNNCVKRWYMKKIIIGVLAVIIAIGVICAVVPEKEQSYIRIHIRANSNSEYDQSVKYKVKDRVVEAITPLAAHIDSKEKMYEILEKNLYNIKNVVDNELRALGQNYTSRIRLGEEEFPTRSYEDLTLGEGIYDALIIELGSGSGDNWWCVAFPPLCFVGNESETEGTHYKSILFDWIKKLKN